jgi:hypothetical protein
MADVFLSYKREDRGRAKEIADAIEAHGFSVFFDVEIGVGEAWNTRIEREVNAAKCVVVLWSERSASSVSGEWVHNEARLGKARAILAPAFISDCEPPLEFSSVQAADLRNWRGDASETEWVRFINRVGELIKREPKKLRAQPWRRRWVRIAAALVVVGVLVGGLTYLRPWETSGGNVANGGGSANSGAGAGPTQVVVPERAWEALGQLLALGDCDGLEQEVQRLGATYTEIADVGPIKVRECRRLLVGAASPPAPVNSADAAPTPSAPTTTTTNETPAVDEPEFLASLSRGDRSTVTVAEIGRVANSFDIDPIVLAAVVDVEGGRAAFGADGRPIILFEPHLFSRQTQRRYDGSHPDISYTTWGSRPYPRTQEGRWEQLRAAYALDPEAALASTTWGRFQLRGANYATAEFSSAREFVAFLAQSDANNVIALARFIRSNNLIDELQRRDWAGFARVYNGPGQADRYGQLMAEAYARLGGAN